MKSPTKKTPAKKPRAKKAAGVKAPQKKIPNNIARDRLVAYLCLLFVVVLLFIFGRNAVEREKLANLNAAATLQTDTAQQAEDAGKAAEAQMAEDASKAAQERIAEMARKIEEAHKAKVARLAKEALKAKAEAQAAAKAQAKATPAAKPKPPAKSTKSSPLISGGPYALTDQNGKTVTDADFHGGFTLVYFGYTFSPDLSPMGLDKIAETLRLLGKNAKKITPIFISVDPERDTPKDLKEYLAHFHPRIVGLTGSHDQINGALSAFKAYAIKTQGKDDYVIDHTSLIYFMGPDGAYRAHFNEDATPEDMAGQIRELM